METLCEQLRDLDVGSNETKTKIQILVSKLQKQNTILQNENKRLNTLVISYRNSETAKNGYKEEELVCNDLYGEKIREELFPELKTFDECHRVSGNYKCDVKSQDGKLKAQVKKFKEKQFQQIHRQWTDQFIENIPSLGCIGKELKMLFEKPLLADNTVDKSREIKRLDLTTYSQKDLNDILKTLNASKKEIFEYVLLGNCEEYKPEYLIGVEYEGTTRKMIIVLKTKDIINYFETLEFKISPRATGIILGGDSVLSIQRKGGDSGRKTSNQLQIKIIISNLLNHVKSSVHVF
jgi:hypothetical protein